MEKFCFASFNRQSPRENIKKDKKFISYNVSVYAMFFARFHFIFKNRKGQKIWGKELRDRCLF